MRMQFNFYARVIFENSLKIVPPLRRLPYIGKNFQIELNLYSQAFIRLFIYYMTETLTKAFALICTVTQFTLLGVHTKLWHRLGKPSTQDAPASLQVRQETKITK